MAGIILCILMNVGIFTCFRLFSKYNLDTFQAITVNYIICVFTGIIFINDFSFLQQVNRSDTWLWIAVILGGVFVVTFYLMAITTQKFSMTVSSIAAKMSLIVPVLSSLFILGIQSKTYSWLNYLGMFIALVAIVMSSYKEKKIKTAAISGLSIFLPLLVFAFGGIIDSTINYTNFNYLTPEEAPVFPLFIFFSAACLGILISLIRSRRICLKSILGGFILGVVNYFSLYSLLLALSAFDNDGAFVYPLINVGIIMISALVSVIFFEERLSKVNQVGFVLAIMAILFISYQEILLL